VTALGMFLVLVMGQTVTTTGSAQGCGRDWPLCHGRFIPDFAFATAIEFSHRAVTGVEGVLIVVFAAAALLLYGRQRPIRVLVPLMLGFLVLQAGMGAWAVVYPQQPVVLALHFGISLIALATTALTALYVRKPEAVLGAPAVSTGVKAATWGMSEPARPARAGPCAAPRAACRRAPASSRSTSPTGSRPPRRFCWLSACWPLTGAPPRSAGT
jgi:cytochrome c oxidase assembly protein subunit 15